MKYFKVNLFVYKYSLIIIFCLGFFNLSKANDKIELTEDLLGKSFAHKIWILEDKNHQYTVDEIIKNKDLNFRQLDYPYSNLDFTTSTFWIKCKIINLTKKLEFILETARPITNEVVFYDFYGGKLIDSLKSGDDFPFETKKIGHRKNLFPFYLNHKESKEIIIKLKSDGEVITLPFIIHQKDDFYISDYKDQFINGIYYGVLALIVVIYFFFFIFLSDKTFFYYVIYVFGLFFLQFSLDGYTFQYLFRDMAYFANHFILFIAAVTVLLLLQYTQSFLKLYERNKGLYKTFKIIQFLLVISIILSLIPGRTYPIMFPVINGISFIAAVTIVFSIFRLKAQKYHVCNFFATAFIILVLGAITFILGNFNILITPEYSEVALKFSSGIEVVILSLSMTNKYREIQKQKEELQKEAVIALEEKNKLAAEINQRLEIEVKERTKEIESQKEVLAEQNEEILSSIKYAKRIQYAILPPDDKINEILPDSFVLYCPKDVVSGDFYFIESTTTSNNNKKLALFSAVDCTGHGVPGAFMSMVGNSLLKQSLTDKNVNTTGEALDFLNKGVCATLNQNKKDQKNTTIRDGMDLAFCALDNENHILYFSGAKNPVYIIREGNFDNIQENQIFKKTILEVENNKFLNLLEIKGDKQPIGMVNDDKNLIPFQTHTVQLKKGDVIYVSTDGFQDQFGGDTNKKESGKKFGLKRFKTLLGEISNLPMEQQKEKLFLEFENWKGELEQVDDVCIIGVRLY